MLDDIRHEVEVTVAPLLRDILQDAQQLFRQEWALAKTEVREDALRAREGATALMLGFSLAVLSFLFANLMLVYFLVEAYGWATWQAYGVVTLLLFISAAGATWWGRRRLRSVRFSLDIPFGSLGSDIH
jgi:hypothetical protein